MAVFKRFLPLFLLFGGTKGIGILPNSSIKQPVFFIWGYRFCARLLGGSAPNIPKKHCRKNISFLSVEASLDLVTKS